MLSARSLVELISSEQSPFLGDDPVSCDEGQITDPGSILLHRGSSRVRFKRDFTKPRDFRYADFNENPDESGMLDYTKEVGKGVSVVVLGKDEQDLDLWKTAHEDLIAICARRLTECLDEARADWNKRNPRLVLTKDAIKQLNGETFLETLKNISRCSEILGREYSEFFGDNEIPFCYTCIKADFYPWAKLMKTPKEGNEFHCRLELNQPTHENSIQAMAQCRDDGWCLCPYMLKAASEPLSNLKEPDLDANLSSVTLSISDALEYLVNDFAQGGNTLNAQEAFEICVYQRKMSKRILHFTQSKMSGLHLDFRLSLFLQRALHEGFCFEIHEDRLIIESDMNHAFRCSRYVVLFDSGVPDYLA